MIAIVKADNTLYRLTVRRELSKDEFAHFRQINTGREVMVYTLIHAQLKIVLIDKLEFVMMSDKEVVV